jgi:hypothetical protein
MAVSHSGSLPSFKVTCVTMVIMAPSIKIQSKLPGSSGSMTLEILHGALVLLCRRACGEGPEIPALPVLGSFFRE